MGGGGDSGCLIRPSVRLSVCGFCSTAEVIESPSAVNLSHLCLFFFFMYFRLSFSESTLDKHLSGDENSLYFAFQSVCSSPQSSFLYSRLFVMASEHVIRRPSTEDSRPPAGPALTICHCGETASFQPLFLHCVFRVC